MLRASSKFGKVVARNQQEPIEREEREQVERKKKQKKEGSGLSLQLCWGIENCC